MWVGGLLKEVTPDLRSEGGAEANSMKREGKLSPTRDRSSSRVNDMEAPYLINL